MTRSRECCWNSCSNLRDSSLGPNPAAVAGAVFVWVKFATLWGIPFWILPIYIYIYILPIYIYIYEITGANEIFTFYHKKRPVS